MEIGHALSSEEHPPLALEQAARMLDEDAISQAIVCGPDPHAHVEGIRRLADAGFDHVYVHQVGPDQEGFMRFYEDEVLDDARALVPATGRVAA